MRKFIIFFVIFCYIYPVFLKFFPIPTDRIIQLIGLVVFLCDSSFWKKLLKHSYTVVLFLWCSIFSVFVLLVQGWNVGAIDLYFFKINVSVFFYFFSSYLIVYLLVKSYKELAFVKFFEYVIYVTIFQAAVSILFFIKPSIFDIYSALIHDEANQNMMDRIGLIEKRMIGIGSAFFTGVTKYGVALFILVALYFYKKSRFYQKTTLFLFYFIIISIVGVLTGRTFFIAILLAGILYCYINFKAFLKLSRYFPILAVILFVSYFLMSFFIEKNRFDGILYFVTEVFENYEKTGKLSTTSSDATLEMYKFPENIKTWLVGDGKMLLKSGAYYMSTDVGFSRLIFYFGLPLTILYFILQGYYLMLISRLIKITKDYTPFVKFFFIMFCWLVLLNFKGLVSFYEYIMLFFMICLVENLRVKKVNRI